MRKIILNIFVAAILNMATVICSIAQPTSGRIEGSVRNEKGEPIEYVTVLLRQPQDSVVLAGTTTSATGQYMFESVARGEYILTMTFVGYHKQSIAIELKDGADSYRLPEVILK